MSSVLFDELSPEQEAILANDFSATWEKLRDLGSQGISEDDYSILCTMDKAPLSDQHALMTDQDDGPRVANMFCNLLLQCKTASRQEELLYVSLWLRVLLTTLPSAGATFFQIKQNPVKPCVDIMYRTYQGSESEIRANVAVACSIMIGCDDQVDDENLEVKKFCNVITSQMLEVNRRDVKDDYFVESLAIALKNCLKCPLCFEYICVDKENNFADQMWKFIGQQQSTQQIQYLQGFCLLLVALRKGSLQREQISTHANLCKIMIEQVASARKEKVRRIFLQTIDALSDVRLFSEMCVMYGIYPILERVREEKFKDDDIPVIVEKIMKNLQPHLRVMSSMERFEKELNTKTLEWGPVHTSDFWKKNFMKFEKSEFQQIKDLVALLDSQDTMTVSVSAFDIGEWARLYPDGRRIVSELGAKAKLFSLLETEDEDLRKQVLLATQKLLVQQWHNIE